MLCDCTTDPAILFQLNLETMRRVYTRMGSSPSFGLSPVRQRRWRWPSLSSSNPAGPCERRETNKMHYKQKTKKGVLSPLTY